MYMYAMTMDRDLCRLFDIFQALKGLVDTFEESNLDKISCNPMSQFASTTKNGFMHDVCLSVNHTIHCQVNIIKCHQMHIHLSLTS